MFTPPPHPGLILKDALPHIANVEDFESKLGIDQRQLDLLTDCEIPITAELSAKIVAYFQQGPDPDLWRRLSDAYYEWHGSK
jgi:plasmid maintenance system antidote protein VapI